MNDFRLIECGTELTRRKCAASFFRLVRKSLWKTDGLLSIAIFRWPSLGVMNSGSYSKMSPSICLNSSWVGCDSSIVQFTSSTWLSYWFSNWVDEHRNSVLSNSKWVSSPNEWDIRRWTVSVGWTSKNVRWTEKTSEYLGWAWTKNTKWHVIHLFLSRPVSSTVALGKINKHKNDETQTVWTSKWNWIVLNRLHSFLCT